MKRTIKNMIKTLEVNEGIEWCKQEFIYDMNIIELTDFYVTWLSKNGRNELY